MLQFINIHPDSTIYYALIKTYGLSYTRSLQLCKELGYDLSTKYIKLTFDDKYKLNQLINIKYKFILNSDLKKKKKNNIKLLKKIRNYKGLRHTLHLPVNGQRTKTNAKTQK